MAGMALCTACSDDEEVGDGTQDENPPVVPGGSAGAGNNFVYILNEGSYQGNNATIDRYAPLENNGAGALYTDIFAAQNGFALGDTGQDMIAYEGHLYVTVYGSSLLVKTDLNGKQVASVSFSAEEGQPRNLLAEDGKIYVALYSGQVMRLDTASLAKEATVRVGANPEYLVEEGGKLYVTNSGWGTGTTMSVINLSTFTLEKDVTVDLNPEQLLACDGKIFVQSYGGAYPDYTYPVRMYDPATGELTLVGVATNMAEYDGVVYMVYSKTDWTTYETTNMFYKYDVATGVNAIEDFLEEMPEVVRNTSVNLMDINPENGDFYIGVTDYVTTGTVYRFDHNGKLIATMDGGLVPKKAVFVED